VTRPHLATAVALGAFTLLTYLQFPGHTWLQQDSQIYVAILEHLDNPATLARDLVCVHPHVKWTAFDEIARALHACTGLSYHIVLDAQNLIFRFLGLVGIFLLAGSAGLNRVGATFVAFLFGLGMSVGGPEILTIEYEAVPRGFALMLILTALGYGAYRRWKVSVAFAAVALLYHPPTSAPYWLAVVVYALALQRPKALRTALIAFSSAFFMLLTLAVFQAGEHESQPLFSVIPTDLIPLLRYRGTYNWVDLWKPAWVWQYLLLAVFATGAWLRLRREITKELSALSGTLLLYGMLSIPLSWLFLNHMSWSMMPQFQPARAVVFICIFAVTLGGAAAWSAARRGLWLESAAWLLPLFALLANRLVLDLFTRVFADQLAQRRLLLVIGLALSAALLATLPIMLETFRVLCETRPRGWRRAWVTALYRSRLCAALWPVPLRSDDEAQDGRESSIGVGSSTEPRTMESGPRPPHAMLPRSAIPTYPETAVALRWPKSAAAALLVPIAAAFLIPGAGQLRNYQQLHTPDLTALTVWAAARTEIGAMFHFADAGHATSPGIFRAEAQRALYVDWKGGGQVSQNWAFAREWQNRWNWTREARAPLLSAGEYASAGIDYVVVGPQNGLPGLQPVYSNAGWKVFDVRPPASH
jgi:hypothetical protein